MLDVKEIRRAIEFYNRGISGAAMDEIELAPIQLLEEKLEELILTLRDASSILEDSVELWTKGQVQPVVAAAATGADYPEDSSYPKDWWLNTIIPQVQALRAHLSTEVSGTSPDEVFFSKPPKRVTVEEA